MLLKSAWQQSMSSGEKTRLFGWSDYWPAARLRFNNQGKTLYIYEGVSDDIISWGPGHLTTSSTPGETGNAVIFGSSSTHFGVLQYVNEGDVLEAETLEGLSRFKVSELRVTHKDQLPLKSGSSRASLTLITDYPFGQQKPDPKYHYVVRAYRI